MILFFDTVGYFLNNVVVLLFVTVALILVRGGGVELDLNFKEIVGFLKNVGEFVGIE